MLAAAPQCMAPLMRTAIRPAARASAYRGLAVALALFIAAAAAFTAPLEDVSGMGPLLLRALDLPLGERIEARLVGPQADTLRTRTGQRSEVFVSAGPVAEFHQAGCKRLDVRVRMPEVKLARKDGAAAEPLSLNLAFNLCPDGSPPLEGADPAALSAAMKGQGEPAAAVPRQP